MKFNGIEKEYVTVLRGRVRPPWAEFGGLKYVKVPVKIDHAGFTDLQRKKEDMSLWLIHDEYKFLEFKDEPDRLYLAKVEEEMYLNEYPYWAEGEIEFNCKEKYSIERNLTINSKLEKSISGHKSTQWRTRTTFTADQTGYELQFNLPGKTALKDICKIKLNGTFRSGDVLEIDYRKRRVTLNQKDITNQLVILQSNFRELDIGGNIEFSASNETKIIYHERYY